MELRQQMPGALDGAGHQLRKETNKGGEAEKIALAMHFAEIKIDGVTQRLEREERDPDREQVFETKRHDGRGI